MSKLPKELKDKCYEVLLSCKTLEQLDIAAKYCQLAIRKHDVRSFKDTIGLERVSAIAAYRIKFDKF